MKSIIRKLIYTSLGLTAGVFNKRNPNILVFCYHGFSDEPWRFNITLKKFVNQIRNLKKSYQFITVRDLGNYLNGKIKLEKPSVLITIDDGYKDIMKIKDYLIKENIKPLVFLLEDIVNVNRKELENEKEFLTDKDIKILIGQNWDFGSHGLTHSDFNSLTDGEMIREITNSKINLEKRLGIKINYFAFPKGRYSKKILKIIKNSGYFMSFTMDDSIINKNTNKFLIPRVGVDNTHGQSEFTFIYSEFAIIFRKIIKKYIPNLAM